MEEWSSGFWPSKSLAIIQEGTFLIGNHADELTVRGSGRVAYLSRYLLTRFYSPGFRCYRYYLPRLSRTSPCPVVCTPGMRSSPSQPSNRLITRTRQRAISKLGWKRVRVGTSPT